MFPLLVDGLIDKVFDLFNGSVLFFGDPGQGPAVRNIRRQAECGLEGRCGHVMRVRDVADRHPRPYGLAGPLPPNAGAFDSSPDEKSGERRQKDQNPGGYPSPPQEDPAHLVVGKSGHSLI
jgi:hypothetical protein